MAGIKITDLTQLTTSASDDLLYIVDVSDTTESPQGTSKQIELGDMFSSGTYTPTVSGVVNGIVATPNSATFIKVGSIVTCSIQLEITMDTGETTGSFELSLPVASDFASTKNLFGLMQCSTGGTILAEIVTIDISAETANNTCFVSLETATATANIQYVNMQFQYQIL